MKANTSIDAKIKSLAFTIAREAFVAGAWVTRKDAANKVERNTHTATRIAKDLASAGCFGEEYGENGSLEIDLAKTFFRFADVDSPMGATADDILNLARHLANIDALDEEDRKRSRALAIDAELKATREKAEEEAEAKRQEERAKKREEIEAERAKIRESLEAERAEAQRLRNNIDDNNTDEEKNA